MIFTSFLCTPKNLLVLELKTLPTILKWILPIDVLLFLNLSPTLEKLDIIAQLITIPTSTNSNTLSNLNLAHLLKTYKKAQPASPRALSLSKKTFHRELKILTTPFKKTGSVTAFRIALTLDVKIVWFGCQVAVCVNKWRTNAIFLRLSVSKVYLLLNLFTKN